MACSLEITVLVNRFLAMKIKHIIKLLIPQVFSVISEKKNKSKKNEWVGNFGTWQEAHGQATGYDLALILEKTKKASLKVKNKEAAYERDSVLFDKIEYSWPVLAGLLRCATEKEGKLHVIDFGGSLGSSYYQNRNFLSGLKEFSWSIVEQKHFVACGKENFEDGVLKFYETIDLCFKERSLNVLLLSGVLHYLENPYEWIKKFCSLDIEYIIADLTPLLDSDDRITVQNVSPQIYQASYPCWLLNRLKVMEAFSEKYVILAEFDAYLGNNLSVNGEKFGFSGFILRRK